MEQGDTYLKVPSVRTDKSWSTNQNPSWFSVSVSLKALTDRLPMRFLVNMPTVEVGAGNGAMGMELAG